MNTSANTHPSSHPVSQVETGQGSIEPVLTLAEIAAHLGVSVQALYDLRTKGRGPRGFKVGRHLHFRVSEVDAWLRQLETQDSCPAAAPAATRLSIVPDPAPSPPLSPAPGPAPGPVPEVVTEDPSQELAGDQWALRLDLPEGP